ncbi:hypothetical protein LPB86_04565 [Pedobacter sp. MC2016-14]|uniref:hypothetical protein n=1 Tax=Pedobacter sp. MC2016-14 TaxID=2897327 RepID=UPI001E5B0E9F|nr:hypothetical protein [Pedobacter sp. MC2016-14]MCD0487487.1 hypothetical protein [Pedobacter sp. MC2016-14]
MAKEIKAIKCPQCSSTAKTEIKPEIYRCNNCLTEYFLDNDDITVNYNHNHNTNAQKPILDPKQAKNLITGIVVVVVGIFLINLLINIFTPSNNSGAVISAVAEEQKEKPIPFVEEAITAYTFSKPSTQEPVVMNVIHREYKDSADYQKTGVYLQFYDPVNKKLIKEAKLENEMSGTKFKFRTFSDGNVYVILKDQLYRLDKDGFRLLNAGKNYFSTQPKFEVGIAGVDFDSDDRGDALVVSTNDGKKYYYYPLIQKVYKATTDERARAEWGFKNLLPTGRKKIYHTFSTESSDFPDEKIQLLKVSYLDNGPGPKKLPGSMSWFKDYFAAGGNGFYTSNDPYVKSLFGVYNEASCRILGAKDLTPGRNYFFPKIAYEDDTTLIIQMKGDASENRNYKLQKLNIKNGKIEWTADLPSCCITEQLVKHKNGYIGSLKKDEYTLFDLKGAVVGQFSPVTASHAAPQ